MPTVKNTGLERFFKILNIIILLIVFGITLVIAGESRGGCKNLLFSSVCVSDLIRVLQTILIGVFFTVIYFILSHLFYRKVVLYILNGKTSETFLGKVKFRDAQRGIVAYRGLIKK